MKRIAVLAAFAAVVGLLAGCSGNDEHEVNQEQFRYDITKAGYAPPDLPGWAEMEDDARTICSYKPTRYQQAMMTMYEADILDMAGIFTKHFCPHRIEEFNKFAQAHQPDVVIESGIDIFAK